MTHFGLWILRSDWLIGRGDQIENAGNHFFNCLCFSRARSTIIVIFYFLSFDFPKCSLVSKNCFHFERVRAVTIMPCLNANCPISQRIKHFKSLSRNICPKHLPYTFRRRSIKVDNIYVVTHIFCWPWLMWYEWPCLAFLSCSSESQSTCVQVSDSRRPLINLATVIRG